MSLSYIFAMDRNRVIGNENKLPWHLPADLKFFKKTTMGHPILMGRKTYESIGKPLPGRQNIVLTRSADYEADGCDIVHTAPEAIARFGESEEAFVIGGAELFHLFMPYADKMYITRIDHSFEGDTFFPEIREEEWRLIHVEQGVRDEQNPYAYRFEIYEKNK
nr:Dihydrofolate reductase [uncultured bacterium]